MVWVCGEFGVINEFLVDFIRTVSKSSRKSMYPSLQEQKERSKIDGSWCM